MDNDITTVAEDVLEGLHALRELNLAGENFMKLLGYEKQFLIGTNMWRQFTFKFPLIFAFIGQSFTLEPTVFPLC